MTDTSFKDRTIIVSGAAGKLGQVICAALYARSANVVAVDTNTEGLASLTAQLEPQDDTRSTARGEFTIPLSATLDPKTLEIHINPVPSTANARLRRLVAILEPWVQHNDNADVPPARPPSSRLLIIAKSAELGPEIIQQTLSTFNSLHGVVNAILGPIPWGLFSQSTDEQFLTLYVSTVLGPLSLIRAAWPYLSAQKHGRIVNFTSDSLLGMAGASAYVATKGALLGLTPTLALEGAECGITVNAISPIAYLPQMDAYLTHLPNGVLEVFKEHYTPEANVLPILALLSEENRITGKCFNTAGNSVGRFAIVYQQGEGGLRSVDAARQAMESLCEEELGDGQQFFEPKDQSEYTIWQAGWAVDGGAGASERD